MICPTWKMLLSIVLYFVLAWAAGLDHAYGQPTVESRGGNLGRVLSRETLNINQLRTSIEGPVIIRRFDPSTLRTTVLNNADNAELRVGEFISATGPNITVPSITDANGRRFEPLPIFLYTLGADGRRRELMIGLCNTDLYWQSNTGDFLAELLVGVFDRNNQAIQDRLPSRVPVQLVAPPGALDRELLQIGQLGIPYEKVKVRSRMAGTGLEVKILSPIEPEGSREVRIGIVKPKLVIHVSPPAIDGFGLQSAQVTIASVDTELPDGIRYTLNATSGKLETANLVTDSSGQASTILHSTGLGQAILSVQDGRFDVAERTVLFRPPLGFALATLLGALLGSSALVAYLKSGQRGRNCRWYWLTGVMLGIGITVALYAGLDIPGMLRLPKFIEGQAVPFALAFMAALLSSTLLERMMAERKS